MKSINDTTVLVPAGRYYLGDPCYCFDKSWHDLLDTCDTFNQPIGKVGTRSILGFRTAYGDGLFTGSDGRQYGVDAGLIGLVPHGAQERRPVKLSRTITFKEETLCKNEFGKMTFGDIVINTRQDDEE